MKLELEVLASTSIKRKKPWPRMAFLGQVQESLFLMDSQRLSTLYIPSGRTKKKIPKLNSLLSDIIVINHSENGLFLGGILKNCDAFLWHKDKDMLKTIPGIPAVAGKLKVKIEDESGRTTYSPPLFVVSDDGSKLLVVVNTCEVYIWERDTSEGLLWPKKSTVHGTWTRIMPDHNILLPGSECKECCNSAVFYQRDGSLGMYGLCSFVYNQGNNICVTTLVLRWFDTKDIYSYRRPLYTAEWSYTEYPLSDISPQAMPIRAPGAYVSSYTHDGSLLAIALNQFDSFQNRMLYVSPWTDSTVVADMKGAGSKTPIIRHARWYWVADMRWTNEDLFLIVITKQGALSILSRLGEPLLVQTHGNSIEMGPKLFLPLHPLIVVQGAGDEFAESQSSKDSGYCDDETDPMRQRFSVATHPTQPIILCSDGYMVTVLAMPSHTTCLSITRGLVTEANRHLRLIRDQQKLQMTMFETLKKQKRRQQKGNMKFGKAEKRIGLIRGIEDSPDLPQVYLSYRFEKEPDESLNKTQESDMEDIDPKGQGAMANIDFNMGKIMFGDVENMNATMDYRHLFSQEGITLAEHINRCQKGLVLAWGLAATHSGRWTADHEDVANHIIHDMVKLFTIILQSGPEVLKELETIFDQQNPKTKRGKRMRGVMKVFSLFQKMIRMLNLDAIHKHLIVCALGFINSTVGAILKRRDPLTEDHRIEMLHACYVLLKLSEYMMKKTYSSPPKGSHINGTPFPKPSPYMDLLDPAILVQLRQKSRDWPDKVDTASLTDSISRDDVSAYSEDGMIVPSSPSELPSIGCHLDSNKRMAPAWKALYKHSAGYYRLLQVNLASMDKKTKQAKFQECELQKVTTLLIAIQCKLQSLGVGKHISKRGKVSAGDKFSIEGSNTLAIHSWIHLLETLQDDGTLNVANGRYLHAILYSHLMQDNPRAALDLIELLIRQTEIKKAISVCKQNQDSRRAILSLLLKLPNTTKILPPEILTSSAARHTVQSLARIMASYFTNKSLFVYPPHAPRRMPPLHTEYTIDHRIYPMYHDSLAATLREKGIGEAWTPERTLEYLLVGGLLPEAVWFVHSLGDWKAAFLMSVALMEHERATPDLYERRKKLYLPQELQPLSIIQEQLEIVFNPKDDTKDPVVLDERTDFDQLSSTLSDLLLAATICKVDLVPWLLDQLSIKLRSLSKQFPPLVPEGLYLPTPPVYCPQPAPDDASAMPDDVKKEIKLRREMSSVIILLQLVLSSSKTTIPAASWYVQKVLEAFAKGIKFKRGKQKTEEIVLDIQVLQDTYLSVVSSFQGLEINPSVNKVLVAFRDMCTITWMMYSRDKLSMLLRKKAALAEKRISKTEKVSEMTWLTHCKRTLEWALHMVSFALCFQEGEQVLFGAVLSLLVELPANEASGKILAEHFYDEENLHPDVQDRLQAVLKEWQGIFLDEQQTRIKRDGSSSESSAVESPRGLTLSLYYQKQVQKVEKLLLRKNRTFGKYDEFVFASVEMDNVMDFEDDGVGCIGSRPCESTEDYLLFLDEFYAVSFHQIADAEKEKKGEITTPLLLEYCDSIRQHELNSLTHRAVSNLQKKQGGLNIVTITSPRGVPSPRGQSATPLRMKMKKAKSQTPQHPGRKGGLFRSRSFSDISRIRPKKISKQHSQDDNLNNSWLGGTLQSELLPTKTHVLTAPNTDVRKSRQLPGIPPFISRGESKLGRSMSVSDIQKQLVQDDLLSGDIDESVDPLTTPVVPEWLLDNMTFGKKWYSTEQLLQWLFRWSNRNHTLVDRKHYPQNSPRVTESGTSPMKMSSAMKIRVPPRMMMYSLWLLENVYYPDPSYAQQAQIPAEPVEVTVAVASRNQGQRRARTPEPPRGVTPPLPDTGRSDLTSITEFSEDITVSALDEFDHDRKNKARKDKKKKKDRDKDKERRKDRDRTRDRERARDTERKRERRKPSPEAPVEPQIRTNAVDKVKVTRKLTFKLPEPDPDSESRQSSARSDSTINVSSLDEDTREFVAEAVRRNLEMTSGSADGNTSPSSKEGTMNSTVRFVGLKKDPGTSQPGQGQTGQGPAMDAELSQQLQNIVRQEMKRIMEAQQQGISAMLGALDSPAIQQQSQQAQMSAAARNNQPEEKKSDCVVMTIQADVTPDLRSYSSDVDVSPLNSDDLFSDGSKSINSKPMTLDELELSRHARRNGQPLNGALQELKSLENQYVSMAPPQQSQQSYFSQDDKENIQGSQSQPPYYPPQSGYSSGGSDQPFSRLFGMLRQVNQKLGAPPGRPPPPSVYHSDLPPDRRGPPPGQGMFPPIQAWSDSRPPPQQAGGPHPVSMPHVFHTHAGQYNEPPQRDWGASMPSVPQDQKNAPPQPGYFGIPLLTIPPETRYSNMERNRDIHLVPPNLIIEYEQKKYGSQAKIKQQMDDYMKKEAEEGRKKPEVKLLKVDIEPFGPADERDNEKRMRRRQQKEQEPRRQVRKVTVPRLAAKSPRSEDRTSQIGTDEDDEDATFEGSLPDTVIRVSPRKTSPRKESPRKDSRKSSPRKTPRSARDIQEEEEEEVAPKIHSGYALTPGMFDEYLDKDKEMGTALDNNARVQYRAAMASQAKRKVLMKDAACDTEGDMITMDAATAIARDQGTDPVNEALQKYYRAKTGHTAGILPPDIFLGLRFNDTNKQQSVDPNAGAEGPSSESGRAFLSVVDIGNDMLDEIPSTLPEDQMKRSKKKKEARLRPGQTRPKVEFQEPEKEEDAFEASGPDRVTVRLLDHDSSSAGFRVPDENEIAQTPTSRRKESIKQRLGDMNHQFNAIAAMAQNIEADLRSTNMLMKTIEQIGEAIHPTQQPEEEEEEKEADKTIEGEEPEESDIFQNRHNLRPSEVQKYKRQDKRGERRQDGVTVSFDDELDQTDEDITDRLRRSLEELENREKLNATDPKFEMSGLSGVSDIVGEVIATGDVNVKDLGFTQKESDNLVERAIKSARSSGRLSSEELQKIFQESRKQKRDQKQKQQLHEWMQKKKMERSKEWKQKQSELREAERQPFTSPAKEDEEKALGGTKDLQEVAKTREGVRQKHLQDNVERRKREASQLMGTILADQVQLPKPEPTWAWDEVPVGGKKRDTSPGVRPGTGSRPKSAGRAARKTGTAPRARFVSPSPVRGERGYDEDRMRVNVDRYLSIRDSHERDTRGRIRASGSGRMDRTGSEFAGTMRTSDGLQAYAKHIEDMDTGTWQDVTPRPSTAPVPKPRPRPVPQRTEEQQPQPEVRPYKPKPFTKMVRLQRPEATRSRQNRPKPTPYVDRLGQMGGAGSTGRSGSSRREQERLYGTKRIPGTFKANQRNAPRVVKTYQQRLADMKASRPAEPLRRTYGVRRSQEMQPPAPTLPPRETRPRKTQTYAEQLQKLQPPKELYRSGEGVPGAGRTFKRAHGPTHKPKTYAQQLQELQKPVAPHPARSRPYADPYMDYSMDDDLSAPSPWSLDHDIHNMIYDGEESSFHPSVAATDIDISQLTELDYMPEDGYQYTDMVGVEDLENIVSVSEGSVMSFIDWDAVENLIADIQ